MGLLETALRGAVDQIRKPGRRHVLTVRDVTKMYRKYESLTDVLLWSDFDPASQTFLLDDSVDANSAGAAFEIDVPDVDGRSDDLRSRLHQSLTVAFLQLPTDDDYPWVTSFYLRDSEIDIDLKAAIRDYCAPHARDSRFSQSWAELVNEHIEQMAQPQGIFYDRRKDGGYRAVRRRLIMTVHRKAPRKVWLREGNDPGETLNRTSRSFLSALRQSGIDIKRLNDHQFRDWFGGWYNHLGRERLSLTNPLPDYDERAPGFDLAETCILHDTRAVENGSLKIGNHYKRFIPLGGVSSTQRPGNLIADQRIENDVIGALWDNLPTGCMMTWVITPQSRDKIDRHMSKIGGRSRGGSEDSKYVNEQIDEGRRRMQRAGERIYLLSMGLYASADTPKKLDTDCTEIVAKINTLPGLHAINVDDDEVPYDGFCRHLPMAFSPLFDSKQLNRSRRIYVRDLTALLPFYGRARNLKNLNYLFFNRSGELNALDPIRQKTMAAHSLVFGPTGSGKTATLVNMLLSNMAIHRPRQYILGKGGAFRLYGQYCASQGLTVRVIDASQEINLPPFANTREALKQIEEQEAKRDALSSGATGTDIERITQSVEGDISRDYLGEMVYLARMMIRGGTVGDAEIRLDQNDIGIIQTALIRALKSSQDKGQAHARPVDLVAELDTLSRTEKNQAIALRTRIMAGAMKRWTEGMHGHFFNRYGEPEPDADVTIVEMGLLSTDGYKDMLGVTVIGLINQITSLGERYRYDTRHIEVYADEQHIITRDPLLVAPFLFGVKTWRALGIWLTQSTQNFDDYTEAAKKMLGLAEWWFLISISSTELEALETMRTITDEQRALIVQARKDPNKPPSYTEGVVLSEMPAQIFRVVQPALSLALAQTDTDEQNRRFAMMQKHGLKTELDAALRIADEIKAARSAGGVQAL